LITSFPYEREEKYKRKKKVYRYEQLHFLVIVIVRDFFFSLEKMIESGDLISFFQNISG
jgi:hypothetical protein